MASINPSQRANRSAQSVSSDESSGRRLRAHGQRATRRAKNRQKQLNNESEHNDYGLPDWEGLKPIVTFLIFPALFAVALVATGGGWPKPIMYGIAGLFGLYVAFSALKGVELVFACILFYIPFSKTFIIPIAPMVNGTNMLILLGIFASLMQATNKRRFWLGWPPGSTLVTVYAFFTAFSAVTVLQLPNGFAYLVYSELLNYKAWLDQFILFVIAISCIRDVKTAKRVWVYLMVGSIFVVIYSIPEMFDKSGRSTIEKSRINGPHQQSNNFGGFVAYTTLPLIALFVVFMRDFRAWLITPYFFVALKILITTFSRGAYLAFAFGGLLVGYLKSWKFLLLWAFLGVAVVAAFPQVLPDSVLARLQTITTTQTSSAAPEQLDRSSEVRLIMWRAAARMIVESPVLGKGFKAFPKIKNDYSEQEVEESDPHNMYLYLGSQMGLPAVALFVFILFYGFFMGVRLARSRIDRYSRAIGIGGAAAVACYGIVCIFGSRAVNSDFTLYFWTYFVVLSVTYRDLIKSPVAARRARGAPKRSNAFTAKGVREEPAHIDVADMPEPKRKRQKPKRGAKPRKSGNKAASHNIESQPLIENPPERPTSGREGRRERRQNIKNRLNSRRGR